MNTVQLAMLLFAVSLGAGGQISMKVGINQPPPPETLLATLLRPYVILGFLLYAVSSLVYISVLRKVALSQAYPIVGFSYVGVVLLSLLLLHESVPGARWAGVALISLGVALVARS